MEIMESKNHEVVITDLVEIYSPEKINTPNSLTWKKERMDIYGTHRTLRREIEKAKKLRDWDRINEFLKYLDTSNISAVQKIKYLQSLRLFFNFCEKPIEEISKQDIINFLYSMHVKAKTKRIRYYCVKKFLEFCGRKDIFSDLKIKFIRKPHLPKILSEEEIDRIIKALRFEEKVIFAILYESGARISEFLNIRKSDVTFDNFGAVLILRGKTGERRIRIVKYANLLKLWHERVFSTFLFPFTYNQIRKMLKRIGRIIGMNIYPHLLRHSRATHLAKYLTESQLKYYFGWSQGSKMASVYVHLSGKDLDEAIIRIYAK